MKKHLKTIIVLGLALFAMLSACKIQNGFGCGVYETGMKHSKRN